MDYLVYKVFKDGRKTYLVFEETRGHEVEYKIVSNRRFKERSDNLIVANGYVLEGTDLYWSVKDMPDDLRGKTVTPVKVVYKK